jgi:hypothetical protein
MVSVMHTALMTRKRTPQDERYGQRLVAAREYAGYSKATDAVKEMNRAKGRLPKVAQSTYDNHEDGFRIPHWEVTKRYADFYGVNRLWLAFEDGPMVDANPTLNEAQRLLQRLQEPFYTLAIENLRLLDRQQDKE